MNLLGSTLVFIWNEFSTPDKPFFRPPLGRYLHWDIELILGSTQLAPHWLPHRVWEHV